MLKDQFPLLKKNPELVYLDNSATTQKPEQVLETETNFYKTENSNVHRGLYPLSENATEKYEASRKTMAEFINAQPEEIIFTSGTTDSINSIVQSFKNTNLFKESCILVSEMEHHSNLIPWQSLSKNINFIKLTEDFRLNLDDPALVDLNPDIVAITLVSNVTGTVTNIKKIRSLFPKALIVIDAAQAVAHIPIDVKKLDADFLAFSGHKMYGPTGIGVLYGKKSLLERLEPFRFGGGMIREVNRTSAAWADLPEKFEAGTPPIAQAIGLAEAAKFIKNLGFEKIMNHENEVKKYLLEKLKTVEGIHIYHEESSDSVGVISFSIGNIHPHDLAQFIGEKGVCVRAGHHCTQVLHREVLMVGASLRASVGIYNEKSDVDKLISAINEGVKFFTAR